LIKEKINL